jgi:uncharacterized ion transporter superfamily protein YfcC
MEISVLYILFLFSGNTLYWKCWILTYMYIVYIYVIWFYEYYRIWIQTTFNILIYVIMVIHVVRKKKKEGPACRVTWKKQTRGVGKHCGLDWFSLFYTGKWLVLSVVYMAMIGSVCCVHVIDWFSLLCTCHWLLLSVVYMSLIGSLCCVHVIDWFCLLCTCHWLVPSVVYRALIGSLCCV